MSHVVNAVDGEVTQGKPSVASMASAVVHCSRENPTWLMYAASGNVAVCLKTYTDLLLFVRKDEVCM